jgi:uncharacterized glyoxalase superfamily protein PhnB
MTEPSTEPSETPSAEASVEVGVDPRTAFRVFTEEIDCWWVRGPINFFDGARALAMRIEPGVGGRVLEIYDEGTGDGLELARITQWRPGELLAYRSSVDDTEVEIRFEPAGSGTRVHVRHRVRPGGDADRASLFWPRVIWMFGSWTGVRDRLPHRRTEVARLHVALYYTDPGAAARWLADAFQLTSWAARIPGEGERPPWVEMRVGDVPVLLFTVDGPRPEAHPVTHAVWVFVDDLDAHLAHAEAAGATIVSGIRQHGYRAYEAEDLEGHRWTFAQARPTM